MNLNELIDLFGEKNETIKSMKKETDELNAKVKEIMASTSTDCIDTGRFVAKYSVVKTESFDDTMLLARIKELGVTSVIKTVEVVDMELLENAIYNGELSGADLINCKVTKSTPKLVVSVKKEKKKRED